MTFRLIILSAVFASLLCQGVRADELDPGMLDEIHRALDSGEIEPLQAVRRYNLAARRHRNRPAVASEARFSAGVAYEKLGRYSDAAEAYGAVVRNYPGTTWFMPAADALLDLGEKIIVLDREGVLSGGFRTAGRVFRALSDVELPRERKAFVYYKMGVCALETGRDIDAEFDFKTVLENYSVQPWEEKAYFKLGEVYAGRVRRPGRDQSHTGKAIAHFESFIERYPDSDLRDDAETYLRELGEIKAEHLYGICEFYHRMGEKDALEVYCGILAGKYPESPWTALAAEQFDL